METELPKKSFLSEVVSFGFVQVILQLRSIIVLPFLARFLGTSGFGYLSALYALVGIIQMISLLGINTAMTVFIPGQPPENRRKDFWNILHITVTFALILVILLYILYPWIKKWFLPHDITPSIYLAGLMIIPTNMLQLILFAQMRNNHDGNAYSVIISIISFFEIPIVILSTLWWGILGNLFSTAFMVFLQCIFMLYVIQNKDTYEKPDIAYFPNLKQYYIYGATMSITGLAAWIVDSSDRLLIGKYLSIDELGIYQVAYNLCTRLNQIGVPFFSPLMPFVAAAINQNQHAEASKYFQQTFKMLLIIFSPLVLLLSLCSNDIIVILSTKDFLPGAKIVPMIAIGIALWNIGGVNEYNIYVHNKTKYIIFSMICGAVINIIINVLFIPYLRLTAAGLSTMISYLVIFLMNWGFAQKTFRINYDYYFVGQTFLGLIGMSFCILTVQFFSKDLNPIVRLCLSATIGGCVFFVVLYRLRAIKQEEIRQIKTVLKNYLPKSNHQ